MLCKFCLVSFVLICASVETIYTEKNVTAESSDFNAVLTTEGTHTSTTVRPETLNNSSTSNISVTTSSLLSPVDFTHPSNENSSEQPLVASKFNTPTEKPLNSSEYPSTPIATQNESRKTIATEGGSNVSAVKSSVSNFQDTRRIYTKKIVSEGGVQDVSKDGVLSKTKHTDVQTMALPNSEKSFLVNDIESVSSMNEGKITARKGVSDPKMTASVLSSNDILSNNNPNKVISPLKNLVNKNVSLSTSTPNTRNPKPTVTDDGNDSFTDRIQKMDYVVPIVCTVFSVPLLIVLAIYLYKRGADLWERRHYNRMDFLIEGIYNQ